MRLSYLNRVYDVDPIVYRRKKGKDIKVPLYASGLATAEEEGCRRWARDLPEMESPSFRLKSR